MNVLVVVNHADAPAGLLGQRISALGGHYDAFDPHHRYGSIDPTVPIDLPDTDIGYDALVVLGGYQDAWDDAAYPAFGAELSLIRRFHEAGKPVLGLCLGAQLVARAFGATVRRMGGFERGVIAVRRVDGAAADPVIATGPGPYRVASWHQDTFDLPDGARHLLASSECPNQAFVIGGSTYAFQCHLEATAETVRNWIVQDRARNPETDGAVSRAIEADLHDHFPAVARFGQETIDRWLGLIRGR